MGGATLAGRYRLVSRLGAGGMGEVWSAVDERLGRRVAVKLLARPGDTALAARLRREAKAAARINDRHVVAVHDVGEAQLEGQAVVYLVMELVEGRPLDQVAAGGRPTVADVVHWGLQICAGLQAAHAAGVVHRDIKPANILLTASGELKLCDFGIARDAAAVGHTLTGVGNVVGTPAYMSPEHARGEAVGPRSDLYALGCVLYELLTGAPPFRGEGWQVLGQHASREPAPVRELRADVPAPLDALVTALLTKQPRQRPASAAEVAERLRGTAATAADTTLDAGAAGTPALPSAVGRPSGGTGVAGRAGVLDTVVVGGQLALFSPLPLPAAAALGIVAGGVIAAGYELEARQEAAGAASSEALPLSAVGVLLALVIAAAVMVGLLVGSPAPWWAAVLAGMVTGPVLVGCAAAVRAAVELCVVRGAPHADAACTAGMLSAVVAAALTATGAHVPVLVTLLAGAGTWVVIAGAAAVVLPGPRAVRP